MTDLIFSFGVVALTGATTFVVACVVTAAVQLRTKVVLRRGPSPQVLYEWIPAHDQDVETDDLRPFAQSLLGRDIHGDAAAVSFVMDRRAGGTVRLFVGVPADRTTTVMSQKPRGVNLVEVKDPGTLAHVHGAQHAVLPAPEVPLAGVPQLVWQWIKWIAQNALTPRRPPPRLPSGEWVVRAALEAGGSILDGDKFDAQTPQPWATPIAKGFKGLPPGAAATMTLMMRPATRSQRNQIEKLQRKAEEHEGRRRELPARPWLDAVVLIRATSEVSASDALDACATITDAIHHLGKDRPFRRFGSSWLKWTGWWNAPWRAERFDAACGNGLFLCPGRVLALDDLLWAFTPPDRSTGIGGGRLAVDGLPIYDPMATGDDVMLPVGTVADRDDPRYGRRVGIYGRDLLYPAYICGATRQGKSFLMEGWMIGLGAHGCGFTLIDPHDDNAKHILQYLGHRQDDIYWIQLGRTDCQIGFNPLAFAHTDEEISTVTSWVVGALQAGLHWNEATMSRAYPMMLSATRAIVEMNLFLRTTLGHDVAAACYGHLFTVRDILVDEDFRSLVLRTVKSRAVKDYFEREYVSMPESSRTTVLQALTRLQSDERVANLLGQSWGSLDMREAMDNKKIVIVSLAGLDDKKSFIGALFLFEIFRQGQKRIDIPPQDRVLHYLFADEIQSYECDMLTNMLNENAKYGLRPVFANQFINLLSRDLAGSITSNTGQKITFKCPGDSGIAIAKSMGAPELTQRITTCPPHHAIASLTTNKQTPAPVYVQTVDITKLYVGLHDESASARIRAASDERLHAISAGTIQQRMDSLKETLVEIIEENAPEDTPPVNTDDINDFVNDAW